MLKDLEGFWPNLATYRYTQPKSCFFSDSNCQLLESGETWSPPPCITTADVTLRRTNVKYDLFGTQDLLLLFSIYLLVLALVNIMTFLSGKFLMIAQLLTGESGEVRLSLRDFDSLDNSSLIRKFYWCSLN